MRGVQPEDAHRPDEGGFAGGLEGLVFGLLLFVVGTLLVATVWSAVDTKLAVTEAARQAARSYVEAPDAALAVMTARDAADASLRGYGRQPSRGQVELVGGRFSRCDRVTIAVRYPAPVVVLPFVGRVGTAGWISATHSELVDPFHSGLPGSATCP